MARDYTQGYVTKAKKHWRAVINWQEGGKQRRLTIMTGVPCFPDKVDEETGAVIKRDNRGKTSAESFLRNWRNELIAEQTPRKRAARSRLPTVAEYVECFIESKEKTGAVRDVTTRGYRSHLGHVRGSELGKKKVNKVTPSDITDWEHDLIENGMSPSTISHTHVFLKQVFSKAYAAGDIEKNPFDLVEAPRREHKPINALPPDQIEKAKAALVPFGPSPLATAAMIAMKTGMRQGEICALRWQDIDFARGLIHVNHALTRQRGHYRLASPKTSSSLRAIPFGPSLREALSLRKAKMEKELNGLGEWRDGLYVIGSAVEGTWKSPQALSQEWHQFARVADLTGTQGRRPTFHDLRHTFATIAVGSSIDVKTVSALLGHADPAMTLRVYSDSLESSKRDGMEKLDGVL